ncbi:hypothetical protein WAI453_007396 [Rhynchosporium graminicola]
MASSAVAAQDDADEDIRVFVEVVVRVGGDKNKRAIETRQRLVRCPVFSLVEERISSREAVEAVEVLYVVLSWNNGLGFQEVKGSLVLHRRNVSSSRFMIPGRRTECTEVDREFSF